MGKRRYKFIQLNKYSDPRGGLGYSPALLPHLIQPPLLHLLPVPLCHHSPRYYACLPWSGENLMAISTHRKTLAFSPPCWLPVMSRSALQLFCKKCEPVEYVFCQLSQRSLYFLGKCRLLVEEGILDGLSCLRVLPFSKHSW